jgi:predicted MPP superfamily phosphohydrolase
MPRRFLIFLSIVLSILGGTHYYLYAHLVTGLGPFGTPTLWAIRAVFVLGAISFPLLRVLSRHHVRRLTVLVDWLVVMWLGCVLYAFLLGLAVQVLGALSEWTGLLSVAAPLLGSSPQRSGVLLVVALTAMCVVVGFVRAQALPRTVNLEVPLAHLPPSLDGFKVIQLSDVHIGTFARLARIRGIVEKVNALVPDLVVITGDLVDEQASQLAPLEPILAALRARHGVLAVPGNHDFFAGIDEVVRRAATCGIRFLRNEKVTIAGALQIYGIDDPMGARLRGGRSVPFESVLGPEVREQPSILLYHQPIRYPRLAEMGVGLVLSGHTHGGQLWPLTYISRLFYPYVSGLFSIGTSHFYVSRGTGTWGPPMRFGVPPEIVVIRLRSPGASALAVEVLHVLGGVARARDRVLR